jgi:short-subunit dehydrogenase
VPHDVTHHPHRRANSGIGLATAVELARRGFRSVGTVRSAVKAGAVAEAAAAAGVTVETAILDVTDGDGCAAVIDEYRPYALVNNAGYAGTGAVEDVDDDAARAQLEAMVVAPIRLARLALAHQRAAGGGRIVNVSSIYGLTTTPLSGWYQASKHALEAVSDALRMEVAHDGIRVVLVEPGAFRTGIWDDNRRDVERHAGSPYEGAYGRLLRMTRLATAAAPDPVWVARVIGHAVAARAPRARYLVGVDAVAAAAASRMTPTALKDRVIRLTLGL